MKGNQLKYLLMGITIFINLSLQGAEFLIDFSNHSGSPGGNWNLITTNGPVNDLTDNSTGAPALGTFVTDNAVVNTNNSNTPTEFTDWVDNATVARDTRVINGLLTVTIGGLTDPSYTFEAVSAWDSLSPGNLDLKVQNATADRDFLGLGGDLSNWLTQDAWDNGNWLIWDNVVPDENEIDLEIFVNPGSGILPIVNAVRITTAAVPEPKTYLMFATILAGGVFMKMRNRKRDTSGVRLSAIR